MADGHNSTEAISLTALAVELGVITPQKAKLTEERRENLRRGGIKISLSQTLLEQQFVLPHQIKQLTKELEKRNAGLPPRNPSGEMRLKQLGPFQILEVISEKSHSRIVKARESAKDRLVILKIMAKTMKDDPQWSERFKRETALVGKLSHPNLVQAYGTLEVEGCPVIVMEHVDGPTLAERIEQEGCLAEKDAWLIAREIAKALSYAATLGIIHRDIKPENILCGNGGKIKLIDMGFSKSLTETSNVTVEGTTVGTPFYISPEQACGSRELDARTDIYSLGCTTYHTLTGSPPFWGNEITEIMLKHVESPRPNPRKILPSLSGYSVILLTRMMAIEPEKRPASADAVVEEIATLLNKLPKQFMPEPIRASSTTILPIPPPSTRNTPPRKVINVTRIPATATQRFDRVPREFHVEKSPPPPATDPAPQASPAPPKGLWSRFKAWFGR